MMVKHVLAIFALAGMFVLSVQYPRRHDRENLERNDSWEEKFLRNYLRVIVVQTSNIHECQQSK